MDIKVIKGTPDDRELAAIVAAMTMLITAQTKTPVSTIKWARPQLRRSLGKSWRDGAAR
jgi:hypothetical protein